MDWEIFVAFVIATAIMISLPGPSVLLTVAHGITHGWHRALVTVAGATTGVAVQLAVAVIGLASLLHVVAEAFEWVRWAGAAYLIYLGIKQWRSANAIAAGTAPAVSGRNLFLQGLIITIPNPKSLIFIAAFLPQFIDTTRPPGAQFAVIVPTFLVITFTVTSVWALLAGNAREFLMRRRTFQSVLKSAGGLMIVTGVGLALARRGH